MEWADGLLTILKISSTATTFKLSIAEVTFTLKHHSSKPKLFTFTLGLTRAATELEFIIIAVCLVLVALYFSGC